MLVVSDLCQPFMALLLLVCARAAPLQDIFNDFESDVEIEMALLINFMIDYTWLVSVVPALQVIRRVVFIKGDDASPPESLRQPGQHFHCRAVPPPYGSFHAKV